MIRLILRHTVFLFAFLQISFAHAQAGGGGAGGPSGGGAGTSGPGGTGAAGGGGPGGPGPGAPSAPSAGTPVGSMGRGGAAAQPKQSFAEDKSQMPISIPALSGEEAQSLSSNSGNPANEANQTGRFNNGIYSGYGFTATSNTATDANGGYHSTVSISDPSGRPVAQFSAKGNNDVATVNFSGTNSAGTISVSGTVSGLANSSGITGFVDGTNGGRVTTNGLVTPNISPGKVLGPPSPRTSFGSANSGTAASPSASSVAPGAVGYRPPPQQNGCGIGGNRPSIACGGR